MFKKNKIKKNRGMTYVELIVVLSIFAIMSSVAMFNYRDFEARVNIKNLSVQIAQQIVSAQKDAMAGKLSGGIFNGGKPKYGVYFDIGNPNKFIYFADFNDSKEYDAGTGCGNSDSECIQEFTINNGDYIKNIKIENGECAGSSLNKVNVFFERPDSSTKLTANGFYCESFFTNIDVLVMSPQNIGADVMIYPSGRIEINNTESSQTCIAGVNCGQENQGNLGA